MLIVKPIPPNRETPRICLQFKSFDSVATFVFTAKNEIPKMPMNFPIINPKMIPNELLVVRLSKTLSGKMIAVLARAKMGRMIKATG